MKLKTEIYKNVEITYEINEEGLFTANALGILSSYKDKNTFKGWQTLLGAQKGIKEKIDVFLSRTPKNYKELATAIEETLVWTGYEDCYVNEFILKKLVENFNIYNTNK
jgi:hypothetical protein